MCGIIGYNGFREAPPLLIDSLKKLEYRGYDSAGIAVFENNCVKIVKTEGKVSALEKKTSKAHLNTSHCGIGHTRWATHGEPNDTNAHPHRVGTVTLVHNGIIENYAELQRKYDLHPISDTDSEVAAGVLNALYEGDAVRAVAAACRQFEGAYALCILFDDQPDTVYAVRHGSPLIVAKGENEVFLASDIPAILEFTRCYYLPSSKDIAVLQNGAVTFVDFEGTPIQKQLKTADWNEGAAKKDGYDHFMLKEIFEQPEVVHRTIAHYQNEPFELSLYGTLHIVACGSAYHAGLLGKYAIEKLSRRPVQVHYASEFRYDDPILQKDDVVLAISQSGETADTLAAVRLAKEKGVSTLGIANVRGCSLSRECERTLYTLAGPEIAVATTKAYLCQVCLMLIIALRLADPDSKEYKELSTALNTLPAQINEALGFAPQAKKLSHSFKNAEHIFFMGRGQDYALAMEGSLKLKEISYIHSESYPAGELKHGTISLIEQGTPVVAVLTDRKRLAKTASNLKEVAARGARIFAITYGDVDTSSFASEKISLPNTAELTAPLGAMVRAQLLSYYIALARGCDIDQPRNLAKSVTVE